MSEARPDCVVQGWLQQVPWKQQSILFSSLRGPDAAGVPAIKRVNRWMRTVTQHNADPSKEYMRQAPLPDPMELCNELEFQIVHYVHHFADGLAVIAYHHPDEEIRKAAYGFHAAIAEELFHFVPEEPGIFNWRHRDKPDGVDPQPEKPYDDRPWMHALLPDGYVHG